MSHTPGPWAHEKLGGDQWLITAADLSDYPGDVPWRVAVVLGSVGYDGDQSPANARLIAASPDLFAACHAAREILETLGAEHVAAYEMVSAAISKATNTTAPTQSDRLATAGRHPSNSPFAMQRT